MALAKTENGDISPHVDSVQTEQACKVLLQHISDSRKKGESGSARPDLLSTADESSDSDDEEGDQTPIWLVLTAKKHIVDKKRLKPGKITLPNPINTSIDSNICLITADPQHLYRDTIDHPTFPSTLRPRIRSVISLIHLKKDYKSFESRRKLLAEHDIFLADDRVITYLPQVLGKIFYKGGAKRPIPVSVEEPRERDENGNRKKLDPASAKKEKDKISGGRGVASPVTVAKNIQKALDSALVHLAPGTNIAVKVARASFATEQVQQNVQTVVHALTEKYVPKGWKNVRGIHIKGPNTMAFPVWLADELWAEDEDVLEEKRTFRKKKKAIQRATDTDHSREALSSQGKQEGRKRKADETTKPTVSKHARKKVKPDVKDQLAAETALRKERQKKQKGEGVC